MMLHPISSNNIKRDYLAQRREKFSFSSAVNFWPENILKLRWMFSPVVDLEETLFSDVKRTAQCNVCTAK